MHKTSQQIRKEIEENWLEFIKRQGKLYYSDSLHGSAPPAVFVGNYGYPKISVGPVLPPHHGDTAIFDLPERWQNKSLEEIVKLRLQLVRGVKKIRIESIDDRYIANLQDLALSDRPVDSAIEFSKKTRPSTELDGVNAPSGPVGELTTARFSSGSSNKILQRMFYDDDITAKEAIEEAHAKEVEVSRIQKCFSVGMFGKKRKLVPTRWSITATDNILSENLITSIKEFPLIDSVKVFHYNHLGNYFAVIVIPKEWMYEMQEAWYDKTGQVVLGADFEGSKGLRGYPSIEGAYFAARLAVSEYLYRIKKQGAVLVLREIRPEYAIPVGVWQIRQGIRSALNKQPIVCYDFESGLSCASGFTNVSQSVWQRKSKFRLRLHQKTLLDFS